jgi:ubiquinone/menaquinone biosynthesis C-methylase UbiE
MKMPKSAPPTVDAIATYNTLYQSPGRLRDADTLYGWVLDRLAPEVGQQLLDVACGEGVLVRMAEQRRLDVIGLDFAFQAARIAKKESGQMIVVGNGEKLPFRSNSFDYVTNLGSLEHFLDPVSGIREMARVLRHDGLAAILLPNSYYLADIVWHVWRTGYSVSHKQPIERFATYGEWRDLLDTNGLQVVRSYKYNFRFPRSRNDWQWYAEHSRKFLYLALAPFIPFHLSYSFLYICRPATVT